MPTDISSLTIGEVLLRLGLAVVAGLGLGFERERQGRAAGLRTTMLTCVAATLAMILSQYFAIEYSASNNSWRPDPARLAAGVLTGIGFLGAGAIMRQGSLVRGVTTAAVLWYATILGLVLGSGHILLGILGWIVASFALFILPRVEKRIVSNWYATLCVTIQTGGVAEEEIHRKVESHKVTIQNVALEYNLQEGRWLICYDLKLKKDQLFRLSSSLIEDLKDCPGVTGIKWT